MLRRSGARHIDHSPADPANISVAVVETKPIRRRPVVCRETGLSRPSLQPDDCFAAHPVTARVERVAGDHKHIGAITVNAAVSTNSTADSRCRPCSDIGGTVDVRADNPAVVIAAVPHVCGISHLHPATYKS